MTETKCPTCGARCTQQKSNSIKTAPYYYKYKAIPSPDLTKLREAFEPFEEDNDSDRVHIAWCYTNLFKAVKELLKADKS